MGPLKVGRSFPPNKTLYGDFWVFLATIPKYSLFWSLKLGNIFWEVFPINIMVESFRYGLEVLTILPFSFYYKFSFGYTIDGCNAYYMNCRGNRELFGILLFFLIVSFCCYFALLFWYILFL